MSHDALAPAHVSQSRARVVLNQRIARDTFLMRLEAPAIARSIKPGQFVMLRAGEGFDPLLGRPFALYDVVPDSSGVPCCIDLVYLVLGRGTAGLSACQAGVRLPVWGPLGNGFQAPAPGVKRVVLVAGGIGQTPFLALAKWWCGQAAYGNEFVPKEHTVDHLTMYYGVRSADRLAGLDDFRAAGIELRLATDDGSAGERALVTALLDRDLSHGSRPDHVIGCGPEPMLKALAGLVERAGLPCDLSLENHMACGFGACFSCVAPIRGADGAIDLKRVCVDGPVFPSSCVVFDDH